MEQPRSRETTDGESLTVTQAQGKTRGFQPEQSHRKKKKIKMKGTEVQMAYRLHN